MTDDFAIDNPAELLAGLACCEARAPLPRDLETLVASALASMDVRRLKVAERALRVERRGLRESGRLEPERLGALLEKVRTAMRDRGGTR